MSALRELAFAKILGGGGGSGGATNIVTGTFTGTTDGALTVNIPYTGSGYPIAVLIYPSVGSNKTDSAIATLLQKNAIVDYCKIKNDFSTAPTYSGASSENYGTRLSMVHDSATDATIFAARTGMNGTMFASGSASETSDNAVRFNSATALSVYISSASSGFPPNIEYTYWVIYSA